jgi:hypothetical protein
VTLVLPAPAAEAHLRGHNGGRGAGPDTPGPCT